VGECHSWLLSCEQAGRGSRAFHSAIFCQSAVLPGPRRSHP
jgi:hypothetical protein